MTKYRGVFAAPKPNKSGTGSTVQFALNTKHGCVLMTLAKQVEGTNVDSAKFDYENKITFKLNTTELGQFLRVFMGKDESINNEKGLFHSFEGNSSTIKCKKNDPKYGGFYLTAKRGESSCAAAISDGEAEVLISLFTQAIVTIYAWGQDGRYETQDSNK